MKTSLRGRILSLFTGLTLLAFLATISTVFLATRDATENHAESRLAVGVNVLNELLLSRGNQLRHSASLLAADFGFKSAISARDRATIHSLLNNHGYRIKADLMAISTLDGEVIASSVTGKETQFQFSVPGLLSAIRKENTNSVVVLQDGKFYQLVVVPVNAPLPVAWAIMGFSLDAGFANQFKRLTDLDVTFFSASKLQENSITDGAPSLPIVKNKPEAALISSFDDESSLVQLLKTHEAEQLINSQLRFSHARYIHQVVRLDSLGGDAVDGVISIINEVQSGQFGPLRGKLLAISSITLLLSVLGAYLIARNVTKPIQSLVVATQQISTGDYSSKITNDHTATAEISELTNSIETMQRDIELREKRIIHQACHDPLTGLPNRAKIQNDLKSLFHESDSEARYCIMEMNVNRFKQINDTFGLQTGDKLLEAIAARLSDFFGHHGMVGRIGADEFVLIFPAQNIDEISHTIQCLSTKLGEKFPVDNLELSISARYGIAIYPDHGLDGNQLLRRANIALSRAKDDKSFITYYENGMDQTHLKTITLLNDLKTAISSDALRMYYQPKFNLKQGKITQVEALIRWIHPELGFISPSEFIAIAEQSGIMPELTRWVIKHVVQEIKVWREESIDVAVAINLSAYDLANQTLPSYVMAVMEPAGLSPDDLIFEVTESAVFDDPKLAVSILQQFKDLGFSLSIDDYGTGYSSLSQLKQLPVDELKIDMSFIRNLDSDKDDQVIVHSTLEMAHNIGLTVVAEGVENKQSWEMLARWGTDKIQGYYLARPMPPKEFSLWNQAFDPADYVALNNPMAITSWLNKRGDRVQSRR